MWEAAGVQYGLKNEDEGRGDGINKCLKDYVGNVVRGRGFVGFEVAQQFGYARGSNCDELDIGRKGFRFERVLMPTTPSAIIP